MTTPPEPPPARRSAARRLALPLAALLASLLAALVVVAGAAPALLGERAPTTTGRQEEVATRGRQVMPFALERTTHVFEDRPDGGVQTVVADIPGDDRQVALIRAHLGAEAGRFARGDYGDPARIHGDGMPGLAALERGAGRVEVAYADLPDGGRISYRTDDPLLVDAVHAWFAAQTGDHGEHAEHQTGP